MSRLLIVVAVVALIFVGILVALGARSGERPLTHVEKVVALGDLTKK